MPSRQPFRFCLFLLISFLEPILGIGLAFAQYPALTSDDISLHKGELKNVESICQLPDGRCFFGNQNGIAEWRGNSYILHSLHQLDSTLSREVYYLKVIDSNRIWFSCYPEGWGIFEPDTRKIINLQKKIPNSPRRINSVFKDSQNRIWLGCNNENEKEQAGLYLLDEANKKLTQFQFAPKEQFHLRQNADRINAITQAKDGNLWLSTWAGILQFNPKTGKSRIFESKSPGNPFQLYTSLQWANDSILLVGSWGSGLLQFNIRTFKSTSFLIHKLKKHRGTHNIFLDMCEAKPGLFLIASLDAGILLFDYSKQKLLSMPGIRNDLSVEFKQDFKRCFKTYSGDVLLGTVDQGILRLKSEIFDNRYYFFEPQKEILNVLHSIQFDPPSKTHLALSLYGNSLFLFNSDFSQKQVIQPYPTDAYFNTAFSLGNSNWLIQSTNGWFILNLATRSITQPIAFQNLIQKRKIIRGFIQNQKLILVSNDSAFVLTKDLQTVQRFYAKNLLNQADGNLVFLKERYLISCNKGGELLIADSETHQIIRYKFPYLPGLKNCIELKSGNWLLVNFEAAFLLKNPLKSKPELIQLTTKELQGGSNFQDIYQTPTGTYLISEFGLIRYHEPSNQLQSISFPDGRLYFQTNYIPETNEWAFGNSYSVILRKDEYSKKDQDWFGVVNVLVNQKMASAFNPRQPETLHLKHYENFLDIEFGSFLPDKKASYHYQLEGIDVQRQSDLNNGHAVYSNLNPGKYTFRVWKKDDSSNWIEGMPLSIELSPIWHQQLWFKLLVLLVSSLLIILFIRFRKQERDRKSQLQKARLEADLKALRSQMNPHFIFNSLNSINRYIIKNDPINASDYLSKFARLIRMILDHSNEKTIPLSKEIQFLNYYLELEQVRLNKAFSYEIELSEHVNTDEDQIQPMLLQPFLENAIWHGIMNKVEKNGRLFIKFSKENNVLRVEINDNGIGRAQAARLKPHRNSASVGIQLTKERLLLLDPNANIQINDLHDESGNPSGTCVIVQFQIQSYHD